MNKILIILNFALASLLGSCGSSISQREKALQSEAKMYAGSMGRGQQMYYLDNEGKSFTTEIPLLGLEIESETPDYSYSMSSDDLTQRVFITARPKQSDLKSYTVGVFVVKLAKEGEETTMTVLCESTKPGTLPEPPYLDGEEPRCGDGSFSLSSLAPVMVL